ncbi:MAG: sugar phosphate isomerase/epimerase, partial [Planctomycetota bacterium]|nr:sugar phosphate isomerase/epimerase [Planctomycetota bacterium]
GPFVFWDDLPAACRTAREIGYDAIELFPPSADAVRPAELRKLLDGEGLRLAAVGTGAGWVKHRLHLAQPDESARSQARDFIRSIIDFAGPFGAPAIIGSMQGRSGEGVSKDEARNALGDALNQLAEHAKQFGVPLIYEPLNRYETDQFNRVADAVSWLEDSKIENVRLLCDLFHMNIEETDVAAALRDAGNHVGHVHFVDSNRRPVGHGHLDVGRAIAALRDIGYDGYLSAEAFPYPDPESAARQTMNAYRDFTTHRV